MEYVSVLVGGPFGDHPRCTDPTVAAVARLVNDSTSDAGRSRLATLVPTLTGTPPTGACRTPVIVGAALRAACDATGNAGALRRHLRHAERRRESVGGAGPGAAMARRLDPVYRRGSARRALEASVAAVLVLPVPERDDALFSVLTAALDAASPGTRAAGPARGLARPSVPVGTAGVVR
jgi:hypothetical protein